MHIGNRLALFNGSSSVSSPSPDAGGSRPSGTVDQGEDEGEGDGSGDDGTAGGEPE